MTDAMFDWRPFLVRWSEEWGDALRPDDSRGEPDEEARRAGWLGFAPAPDARIAALEERLGLRLPPSYRAFLQVTDGWRHAGGFVWRLAGTEDLRRHEDASGLAEWLREELDEDSTPEEVLLAGMGERALQLDVESDATYVLMDPGDVGDDGEWAVYEHATWSGDFHPRRHASFRAFMEAMHRQFHMLRASRLGEEFTNSTTQALDRAVDNARLDALRGHHEQADSALAEAEEYGRPRAKALRDQIRRMLGDSHLVDFGPLKADPLYAPEVLPVLAPQHVRDGAGWRSHVRAVPETVRATAAEILRQVLQGTFRYTVDGPFGRAVDEAREQARWGETDAAWRTLRAALPSWRPLGPDHLAPVGLLADPLLGPLLTADRGRELLATPRGGETGTAPAPTADADPPGLAWLAEPEPTGRGCRFVLVEGVEPAELPDRLADDTAGLNEPMELWRARQGRSGNGLSATPWEDRALAAVGRAGPGWSFAFDVEPWHFHERTFRSPAGPASRGSRAVVVWGDFSGLFHLSVGEDGAEKYAFTVQGTTTRRSGAVPPALDPDRFFGPAADASPGEARPWQEAEREALSAVAAEFGVRLPRFALTDGRLHTFTTLSWTRPPEPGAVYQFGTFTVHPLPGPDEGAGTGW
ncbi:SMI1/KNR4 family protein [Streptomyces koelreuteriae]|uniref:SMI1/KNR4 family protein n=1 Tax=Streptomyces koelreuteriae TaxID=2838015 RepID=UPI003EB8C368